MPYASTDDLPAPVRNSLPQHAQEIFAEAFNHAFAEHHAGGEVTAFKIAWGAVKRSYHKKSGRWIRKEKVRRAH